MAEEAAKTRGINNLKSHFQRMLLCYVMSLLLLVVRKSALRMRAAANDPLESCGSLLRTCAMRCVAVAAMDNLAAAQDGCHHSTFFFGSGAPRALQQQETRHTHMHTKHTHAHMHTHDTSDTRKAKPPTCTRWLGGCCCFLDFPSPSHSHEERTHK